MFLGADGPLIEELRAAGVTVARVPWQQGARNPMGAARFWRAMRKQHFAIVHQHFGGRSVTWMAAVPAPLV